MDYLLTFLEGIISFISPCMLPMLPVYISYFAGGADKKHKTLARAAAFVLGFTVVFTLLGLFAGTLGVFLSRYRTVVNIICGLLVIVFGLGYLDVIPLPFFRGAGRGAQVTNVFSAFAFGVIYSVGLTPCIGAFLGSALALASTSGGVLKGTLLLLCYSLGLGIPFILSAALIEKLNTVFTAIKKHYKVIKLISGIFLIIIGLLMVTGLLSRFLALLTV